MNVFQHKGARYLLVRMQVSHQRKGVEVEDTQPRKIEKQAHLASRISVSLLLAIFRGLQSPKRIETKKTQHGITKNAPRRNTSAIEGAKVRDPKLSSNLGFPK